MTACFKLPSLAQLKKTTQEASSLRLAWADEWTNIATAVTVTEGRLCAGELAADGTGTDILCDTDHPSIDSSGNVVVSGVVSATTLNAAQLCDEDGANCRDLSDGISSASVFSCPAGFTLIQDAGQTLGCFQNAENSAATCGLAVGACWSNYGAILPSFSTYHIADTEGFLTFSTNRLWSNDAYFDDSRGRMCGQYSATDNEPTGDDQEDTHPYHCFIPATGQISMTTVAALSDVSASAPSDGQVLSWDNSAGEWVAADANAGVSALASLTDVSDTTPTEGQLLSYDASANEWVARTVVSETIILNSADDNPCVVTGGVRKLSFNPATGRLRVCRP